MEIYLIHRNGKKYKKIDRFFRKKESAEKFLYHELIDLALSSGLWKSYKKEKIEDVISEKLADQFSIETYLLKEEV